MDESELDKQKLVFMYASINDIQAVNRVIDAKLAGIIAILSLPFVKLDVFFGGAMALVAKLDYFGLLLICVICLLWLASFLVVVKGLFAIDNPSTHINGAGESGVFYSGDLFTTYKFRDNFFRRSDLLSKRTLPKHVEALPTTYSRLVEELAFEQMKLCYIRGLKIKRANAAYKFTGFTVAILSITWLAYLIMAVIK